MPGWSRETGTIHWPIGSSKNRERARAARSISSPNSTDNRSRVRLGRAREQALRGPEPGEHAVADALAGQRVGHGRGVAHEQDPARQALLHRFQGPGPEHRDRIAVARPRQVAPARGQMPVEEGVERGAGGAVREPLRRPGDADGGPARPGKIQR